MDGWGGGWGRVGRKGGGSKDGQRIERGGMTAATRESTKVKGDVQLLEYTSLRRIQQIQMHVIMRPIPDFLSNRKTWFKDINCILSV